MAKVTIPCKPIGYERNLKLAKGNLVFYKVQNDPPECAVPAIVDSDSFAGMTGRWVVLQREYHSRHVTHSGRIIAGFNEIFGPVQTERD